MKKIIFCIIITIITLVVACSSQGRLVQKYTITIDVIGKGTVTPESSSQYSSGTIVKLETIPDRDYEFASWKGYDGKLVVNNQIVMNKNMRLKAVFEPIKQLSKPIFTLQPIFPGFDKTQQLGIECTEEGVSIYYTRDGTLPKKTPEYIYNGEPILIDSTTTIKAIACKEGFKDSQLAAEEYRIMEWQDFTIPWKDTNINSTVKDIRIYNKQFYVISETEDNEYLLEKRIGDKWLSLAEGDRIDTSNLHYKSMEFDGQGRPYLTFYLQQEITEEGQLIIKHLSAEKWQQYGSFTNLHPLSTGPIYYQRIADREYVSFFKGNKSTIELVKTKKENQEKASFKFQSKYELDSFNIEIADREEGNIYLIVEHDQRIIIKQQTGSDWVLLAEFDGAKPATTIVDNYLYLAYLVQDTEQIKVLVINLDDNMIRELGVTDYFRDKELPSFERLRLVVDKQQIYLFYLGQTGEKISASRYIPIYND